MNAPEHINMDQESPPPPILIRLPSTPTKNPLPYGLLAREESPHQMMLVQTPVKEEPKFMDILLESESPPKTFFDDQDSYLMEEEYSSSFAYQRPDEGTENQEPNICHLKVQTEDKEKINEEKQQKQQANNLTFKTPGRSHRSITLSTAPKRKPCTCKKSGCLKKYCQCFKAGQVCDENCDCIGCKNNDPTHLKSGTKSSMKTASISCNCKKSNCLKGYCDCHNAGSMCSQLCNCVQCKNQVPIPSDFSIQTQNKKSRKVRWQDTLNFMQQEEPCEF